MKSTLFQRTVCLGLGLLLAACQTPPPSASGSTPPTAEQSAVNAADVAKATKEQELSLALDLYADGQFGLAILALRPLMETTELSAASQLRAIKFMALSHCIQGQTVLCRQYFEQALKLNPDFQLADTEASHPVWGAEFRRAQRNNTRQANTPPRAADRVTP